MTPERSLGTVDPEPEKQLAMAGPEAQPATSPELKEHILFVDDEQQIVQVGREMLEYLGYRVTGHTDSREALESVQRQPGQYDLVITDFSMPRMNGVELARELSRLIPGIPIILYTAKSMAVSPEKARKLGIKDYLLKPVTAAQLHRAIRRVLDAGMSRGTEVGPQ